MSTVNLSSRPFTNHRLFWAALAIIWTGCALFAWSINQDRAMQLGEIGRSDAAIKLSKLKADQIQKEKDERALEEAKIYITYPEQVQLAAARQLIRRRVFSWDKMISDLEENVPKQSKILAVKLDGIDFGADGNIAKLTINATGSETGELTEMMGSFEKSNGLFTVGEVSQGQMADTGQIPFTLAVEYRPAAKRAD
ncbi:MAG TPA: hypothetical protein VI756_11800 [Blastocatellia bacterium]